MHPSPRPEDGPRNTGTDTDVLIVGYGPVGQLLAIQLARRGRRVTVVERWLSAYPMPRAVAFDSEGARLLAAAGLGEAIADIGEPSGDYTWKNAAGQALLHIDVAERGLCGWPESTSMYQPALEAALTAQGATFPRLTVLRGHEGVGLADHGDHVELTARTAEGDERVITADWVVGCDGANSFVRGKIGGEVSDFAFSHDWLICDVVLHEKREFSPNNLQICDPARPRTSVSAGPGHRRWEFMRVAGESVEELNTPESAWRLLSMFDVTPANATLERHHVYSFSASSADRWRSGRMLVAGDAAHVMPPFAGQGMTAGFRDVTNLVWKLDAVLRGDVDESFLDTYAVERRPHVKHAIGMSINLGRIICQTDPSAAADRDMVMLAGAKRAAPAGAAQQRSPFQPLKGGFLHRAANGRPLRPAGHLVPQARVARGSELGLFDGVVGTGFVLLAAEDPAALLDAAAREFLQGLGAHLVRVLPAGTPPGQAGEGSVVDVDEVYLPYLAEAGAVAALVRPDFYVYGAARDRAGLAAVIDGLRAQLPLPADAPALTS